MNIHMELEKISLELEIFYQRDFSTDEEDDYENRRIKTKIIDLIDLDYRDCCSDQNDPVFRKSAQNCLLFLAQNSGCVPDFELLEELPGDLLERDVIDKELFDYYYY